MEIYSLKTAIDAISALRVNPLRAVVAFMHQYRSNSAPIVHFFQLRQLFLVEIFQYYVILMCIKA